MISELRALADVKTAPQGEFVLAILYWFETYLHAVGQTDGAAHIQHARDKLQALYEAEAQQSKVAAPAQPMPLETMGYTASSPETSAQVDVRYVAHYASEDSPECVEALLGMLR